MLNQTGKRKARILVVDDDPGLLRLLTIRLRAESYEVEAVESASQALAASSRFRPDLVITDLRMDHMDGIGLLKELQNRWPGLKVIILTAHGTIPDAVQATQMGAFGFLTKPVDKQELLATAEWAGNVRQLHNVVRQNVALSQTPIIPVELVQQSLGGTQAKLPSFDEARDEFTRSYLSQILQITGGNVSQAARLAKRNRTDFYNCLLYTSDAADE